MPATSQSQTIRVLRLGDAAYPPNLTRRLGTTVPATISIIGNVAVRKGAMEAFLCSKETPGATILKAFDQAAAWRDAGVCVISGFHSPVARQSRCESRVGSVAQLAGDSLCDSMVLVVAHEQTHTPDLPHDGNPPGMVPPRPCLYAGGLSAAFR